MLRGREAVRSGAGAGASFLVLWLVQGEMLPTLGVDFPKGVGFWTGGGLSGRGRVSWCCGW